MKENPHKPLRIFISAGEASGDLHASKLCEELRLQHPNIQLTGFGGEYMKQAGVTILYPLPDLALIGFVEVAKKIRTVFRIKKMALQSWDQEKPDAIILVDFPVFHLRLARYAHEKGIPVIYYMAPQVWAWGEKRVHTMKKIIDKMLVIFPFEVPFFQERGLTASYVGHPLAERISSLDIQPEVQTIIPDTPLIGLLPGSRVNEINHMLPAMITAAQQLTEKTPIDPLSIDTGKSSTGTVLITKFKVPDWIEVCRDTNYVKRQEMDFAWTSSGTATVENALLGLPMAVVFRTGKINMYLGRRLVRVPYIGMVNLIAQKGICPEFIQEQCQPEVLSRYAFELLTSPERYIEMKRDLQKVRKKLEGFQAQKPLPQSSMPSTAAEHII